MDSSQEKGGSTGQFDLSGTRCPDGPILGAELVELVGCWVLWVFAAKAVVFFLQEEGVWWQVWAGIMSVPGPVGRADFECLRRERLELETEGPV